MDVDGALGGWLDMDTTIVSEPLAAETYDGLGLFRLVYTTFVAGSLYAFSVVFTGSSCGVSCGTLWVGGGCRSGQQLSGNTNAGKREIEKRIF